MIPTLYFALSLAGALGTLNVLAPIQKPSVLGLFSFMWGWFVSELALHVILLHAALSLLFVALGVLADPLGVAGLALSLVIVAGLTLSIVSAGRAKLAYEEALQGWPNAGQPSLETAPLWFANPFRVKATGVKRIKNIVYDQTHRRQRLDIYRPRTEATGLPVLVQVHGGAWILGDKAHQGLPMMTHLAAQGWVCVSVNYRLSQHATFPAALIDVKRALAWVRENIASYGGDPEHIVITGNSAGGHLASLAALTARRPEYQPGFESADTSVRACIPLYGVYDFTNRHRHFDRGFDDLLLARLVMKRSRAQDPAAYEAASPLSQVHPDAPPFFVIHGASDSLVPAREGRCFVESLRAVSRAPVLYAELPGAQHAFDVFWSRRTAYTVQAIEQFLHLLRATETESTAPVTEASPALH